MRKERATDRESVVRRKKKKKIRKTAETFELSPKDILLELQIYFYRDKGSRETRKRTMDVLPSHVANCAKSRGVPSLGSIHSERSTKIRGGRGGTWESDRGTCLKFRQLLASERTISA